MKGFITNTILKFPLFAKQEIKFIQICVHHTLCIIFSYKYNIELSLQQYYFMIILYNSNHLYKVFFSDTFVIILDYT